ncbi:MAG TPA: DoxX family protein [Thermoanaerobaculia bacterium]|nr:DoxX family protein [Thermoanaerobaculia bacterium]
MDTVIGRFAPQMFAIMRIVTGLLFACHGSQKLLGWPPDGGGPLPPLMVTAGIIELVGGLLVAVGFLTGWAAFICAGEMAVAYFMAHFPHGFLPLVNKGELAVIYSFVFLFIAAHGAGPWSIDSVIRGRKPITTTS